MKTQDYAITEGATVWTEEEDGSRVYLVISLPSESMPYWVLTPLRADSEEDLTIAIRYLPVTVDLHTECANKGLWK